MKCPHKYSSVELCVCVCVLITGMPGSPGPRGMIGFRGPPGFIGRPGIKGKKKLNNPFPDTHRDVQHVVTDILKSCNF